MRIEMINALTYSDAPGVAWQIERVRTGKSDALWLATPHEDAVHLVKKLGLLPEQVYDMYAQRYLTAIDDTTGIWWTDFPVPADAQFLIYSDWTKHIVSHGYDRARVRWFNDAQRFVQAVIGLDLAGKVDYKEIYQRNGALFAKQYFSAGELQQSDFYFGKQTVQVRDFYFEGHRNFVYAYDQKYASAASYLAAVCQRWPQAQFNVTQLDRTLAFVPKQTTLTLVDGVLDAKGRLRAQLADILRDDTHPVTTIRVAEQDYQALQVLGLPLQKVQVVTI
ncbi:hypothetical protein Llac01_14450 [Leuconostoc lactis]|uniref:glycosyltransferase n=1 Tax=Leuconostoc lactis TaxID=1246 RepID=UPI0024A215E7|nr:glycosyltransferase [Leuconostoc lactis]GLY46068.1 hypothetical protein Llac01_14450 [Leuconostoc lactis]